MIGEFGGFIGVGLGWVGGIGCPVGGVGEVALLPGLPGTRGLTFGEAPMVEGKGKVLAPSDPPMEVTSQVSLVCASRVESLLDEHAEIVHAVHCRDRRGAVV
jgi:hypothetical protein